MSKFVRTLLPNAFCEIHFICPNLQRMLVIRSSQHRFTKGKSCLISLVAFYDVISVWVDGERAMDIVYPDFSKAFDTIFHSTFVMKLRMFGTDKWTVRWIEK